MNFITFTLKNELKHGQWEYVGEERMAVPMENVIKYREVKGYDKEGGHTRIWLSTGEVLEITENFDIFNLLITTGYTEMSKLLFEKKCQREHIIKKGLEN